MQHQLSTMKPVLAILTICAINITLCLASCPSSCQSCQNGRIQCPGAGLTSVPRPLPEDTTSIDLSQNSIENLDNMPRLNEVQSFRISMNQLSNIKGGELSEMTSLVSLDLSMNMITKVYKHGFQGLDNVMSISLSGNKITDIGVIFRNTPNLKSLRLANNYIEEIDEESFKSNTMLKMLDISSNKISKIHGDAFKNLDMLRYLILSNNPIKTVTDLSFTSNILSLADFSNCELTSVPRKMPPSLTDFRLGNNKIERINVDDFENITSLKMLTLNDNKISHADHRSFGDLVNLKELWLSRNELVYIPRGLPQALQKLFMDKNVVVELEQMLFKPDSNLTVLNLEGNKVFKIHKDSLKDIPQLEKLNLQGNAITKIESGTFTNVQKLQDLTLTGNPLQEIEAGAFTDLKSLTELSLAYISSKAEVNLAENIFTEMPALTTLDMMNSIELTRAYFDLVQTPQAKLLENLKKWNLQYNEIVTIPSRLKSLLPNIKQLLLDGNLLACDDRLLWLHEWMTEDTVSFHQYEKPTCNSPSSLYGQEVASLQIEDFQEPEKTPAEPESPPAEVQQPQQASNQQQSPSNQDQTHNSNGQSGTDVAETERPTYNYPLRGTIVKIKPPSGGASSAVTQKPLSRKERRKLERERKRREKLLRQQQRRNRRNKNDNDKRQKRRIKKGKNCKKDAEGNVKCEKKKKNKKCKTLEDGTVKCRKTKNKKQKKSSPEAASV